MHVSIRCLCAGLAALALVAAACGSESLPTGIAETGTDTAEGSGSSTTDGSTGADQTTSEAAASGSAAGDTEATTGGATDGTDAKQEAARTIADLGSSEPPVGLDRADVAAATLDAPNDGEIESALGIDRWTLAAEAGQLLAIDVIDIGHECRQDLTLVIESPSGERGTIGWIGNGGCGVHGPILLTESGDYILEFDGGDGAIIEANTGTYRFAPIFLTERDVAPAAFDQPNSGSIDQILGVDRWTFDGTAGTLLTVDVLDIGRDCHQDLNMTIEDPFGERHETTWIGNGGCSGHGPYELSMDGPHAIEFHGGNGSVITTNTGEYRFIPSILTEQDEAVGTAGTRLDGEITQLFGTDRWTFEATAGQLLTLEVTEIGSDCRQDLSLVVADPFGEREDIAWVGNGGCQAYGPFELARDGTYVIEFRGGHGGVITDTTGPYTFTFSIS